MIFLLLLLGELWRAVQNFKYLCD